MIEKIRGTFPELIKTTDDEAYYLFTYENETYGIPISNLTDENKRLLELLLPAPTEDQHSKKWLDFFNGNTEKPPELIEKYRFIIVAHPQLHHHLTIDSFNEIFDKEVIFFWLNKEQLAIFEPMNLDEDTVQFSELVDILSSDLEMNLRIFESFTYTEIDQAPAVFEWIQEAAKVNFHSSTKKVIKQDEAFQAKLFENLTADEQSLFATGISKETIEDRELLETIETVIRYQSNITVVAKKMFMHRNTVQNRIEKFQKITGLDLRNFEDSLNAYFAIRLLRKK